MKDVFWISPSHRPWLSGEGATSIEAWGERFGLDLKRHRKRTQVACRVLENEEHGPVEVYFKAYATCQRPWHGLGRRSRGVLEARNLENFRRWGIAAPKVLAWGYRRRGAGCCSHRSFLITESVPGARALREVWLDRDTPPDLDWRRRVIDQLAHQTRALHGAGFFHQDLKWRNVLVDDQGKVTWIDCPNGYFSRVPWRQRHGRIKDLATLDKVAKDRCTEAERRRFLEVYLGTEEAGERDRWADRVVTYRRRRQDTSAFRSGNYTKRG